MGATDESKANNSNVEQTDLQQNSAKLRRNRAGTKRTVSITSNKNKFCC